MSTPLVGRRGAFVAVGASAAAGGGLARTSDKLGQLPDAALLELVERHRVLFGILNGPSDLDCQDRPEWEPYLEVCDAIGATPPVTMEGLLAKVRAARLELGAIADAPALGNGGDAWAVSLVGDFLRLSGGGAA